MNRRQRGQTTALVPVKAFGLAKSRLAGTLSPTARQALAKAMLRDVLAALRNCGEVDRVVVIGRGGALRQLARAAGVAFQCETHRAAARGPARRDDEVNQALLGALRGAQGAGSSTALVLPADLPWLTPRAVGQVLAAHGRLGRAVTIGPAPKRGGTSVLALRPPRAMATAYGPASAARHERRARHGALRVRRVELGAAARDIDDASDLAALGRAQVAPKAGRHTQRWLQRAAPGWIALLGDASAKLPDAAARRLSTCADLERLTTLARQRRALGSGALVTWSPKVFLPLTQLCRDVCHYCTFAKTPGRLAAPYLSLDAMLATTRRGQTLGCAEALFTLGDQPEARWPQAREALQAMGCASTIDYVVAAAGEVLRSTGVLPHINAGLLDEAQIARLRRVSASMGLMLESTSERLCAPGMPHHGSPDKAPARRLAVLEAAGRARVPFTSGLLIGIGETRAERIDTLLALRDAHRRHGHLQEVIVQDFHPKPGTRMAGTDAPSLDELRWTIAVARLVLPLEVAVQAPPNLNPTQLGALLDAGINDFGGVSPLTQDFVNPEAPWPTVATLRAACEGRGLTLHPRLTVHPRFVQQAERWLDPAVARQVRALADADGLLRDEAWRTGQGAPPPQRWSRALRPEATRGRPARTRLDDTLARAADGERLDEDRLTQLLQARADDEVLAICARAHALAQRVHGARASYVVTRNINYTNRCTHGCSFCAFSRPAHAGALAAGSTADPPYTLDLDAIVARARDAWQRGATEVCLQGGIHPHYDGHTYLDIVAAVRDAVPRIHVHAFSPLEVWHGATTLGLSLQRYLERLQAAGLRSLPGTAAEILDDEVRAVLCPDKINTAQWLAVMRAAHEIGLRSTATMMFGHVDAPRHWARHLLQLRDLQAQTGGFTEFVPLPFVAEHTPLQRQGRCRPGPTFREVLLVHAVARLALHPLVPNIQASWVKLGAEGLMACLRAGANDLGGTLMNESITRAAGARHGQEMMPQRLRAIAAAAGLAAWQRNTLYEPVAARHGLPRPVVPIALAS